ncbi:hypothetical protein ACWGQL_11895 [Streptomyces lydicus]
MHDADRLRAQDAPDFEHLLDRALRSEEIREAVRRTDGALNAEQLRTRALQARAALVATAVPEYRDYLQLRAAAAESRPSSPAVPATTAASGLLPALGVLLPALSATAAVLFLALGLGLRAAGLPSGFADELVGAGLTAAGVAAAATSVGLLWMLIAAARNRSATEAGGPGGAGTPLAEAYEAWQQALLERGVLPFLLGLLDDPGRKRGPGLAGPGGSGPDVPGPEVPDRE